MQVWSNDRFSSTPHRVINRGEMTVAPSHGPSPAAAPDLGVVYVWLDRWRRTFPIAGIPQTITEQVCQGMGGK